MEQKKPVQTDWEILNDFIFDPHSTAPSNKLDHHSVRHLTEQLSCLPKKVKEYIATVGVDGQEVLSCFHQDAVLHDEYGIEDHAVCEHFKMIHSAFQLRDRRLVMQQQHKERLVDLSRQNHELSKALKAVIFLAVSFVSIWCSKR